MGHRMRTWGTFYDATYGAVAAVVDGGGEFAMLYDYPILTYWKGLLPGISYTVIT